NLQWNAAAVAQNIGVEDSDRWLCCMPLFHIGGLSILLRGAILGIGIVFHESFDAERVARSLAEDEITIASLVATQLARVLEAGPAGAGAAAGRPGVMWGGGGPLPPTLPERPPAAGATWAQPWGMPEPSPGAGALPPPAARRKLGSAGRPLLTARVEIDAGEI